MTELWFLAGLAVLFWLASRTLDWVELREWTGSLAHELGHAALAWFACPETLKVRGIRRHLNGYSCHCHALKDDTELSVQERWWLLAFCLGGFAGEVVLNGRLGRPRDCRSDFRKALRMIERLRATDWPSLDWARSPAADVPFPTPLWATVNPRPRLDREQALALALGFRLACQIVAERRREIGRAGELAQKHRRDQIILTRDELESSFGPPAHP